MSTTIIAFRCKDFVMVSASGTAAQYYIKITDDEDHIVKIDSNKLLALAGEQGDVVNFSELIKCNLALNRIRAHDRKCTTPAAASFIRTTLAKALREGPYQVNTLLIGYDNAISEHDDVPPQGYLYYLDYLGTMEEIPFACHGYGASFATAILDEQYREDLTPQQAVNLMQKCVDEVKHRLVMSSGFFTTKCVTANGIETIDTVR